MRERERERERERRRRERVFGRRTYQHHSARPCAAQRSVCARGLEGEFSLTPYTTKQVSSGVY